MSKRSRGQLAIDKLRAKSELSKSVAVAMSPEDKMRSEVRSPIKKLLSSPTVGKDAKNGSTKLPTNRFDATVSLLISKYKSICNVLDSLQSRRKLCSWDTIVESYQTISSDGLALDDLLTILCVWKDAFSVRWQPRTFDAAQNARSYELIVETPSAVVTTSVQSSEVDSPGRSSPAPVATVEASALLRSQRIADFTDKLYSLVAKADENGSTELDVFPDPTVLPPQPAITIVGPSCNKRMRSEISSQDIADWAQDVLNAKPVSDNLNVTLDVLRERAIERGRQAQQKADLLHSQIQQDELNKLLTLLPLITDTLRSLSVRKNRTRMVKKDCVDAVVKAMHLKTHDILQGFEKICSVAPEFLEIIPPDATSPATVHINTAVSYKEVRNKVVEYARSNTKSSC